MPSVKSILSGLTYSAPCTASGESQHDRTECEYAPEIRGFEERSNPAATGWYWGSVSPDFPSTEHELTFDPYNDRISTYGVRTVDAETGDFRQWTHMAWRGRQPIERGIRGARAYAIAFVYGADLPPTEDPR